MFTHPISLSVLEKKPPTCIDKKHNNKIMSKCKEIHVENYTAIKWYTWDNDVRSTSRPILDIQGCIQKYPDSVDNEINNNNNKHSLRSNTKGYGGKTH
jgi:hypothetical protein